MLVAKILLKSVILTKGAKFMTLDIFDFYLNTPMKHPEYMRHHIKDTPNKIFEEYNLKTIVDKDGNTTKDMYGLPHASLIANKLLEQRLNQDGFLQCKLIPGLWSHETQHISFTLIVDDFGVKYVGKEQAPT
ncbi:hypothetical protein ACHAW6_014729 [Cyclotella cf. meneghiniana]